MSEDSIETKTVFGLGQIDGDPLIILGIPAGAWELLRTGKTNTFDFAKAGVNVKIVIFGAETHAEALELMQQSISISNFGQPVKTDLKTDFGIAEKKPN